MDLMVVTRDSDNKLDKEIQRGAHASVCIIIMSAFVKNVKTKNCALSMGEQAFQTVDCKFLLLRTFLDQIAFRADRRDILHI